ncbi:PEP/pyruvate-binding domain-containing protein [Streptomyces sp. DSM 44915]|uniref:PEP/pyruvate-binding domain-containing protein n=1 Tax=Streptomyces chisholmiae TaxID=3075540 RepID=A0ABU2JLD2_9ACTN|nr:PEP/pyruvate-binding domain-containing protein [Streptomyces sp. DSM 44915]MDT0265551.1 PEP/pyruvate-binding domain-containing protein [Streptomyces sp. DSM 44915]
MSGRGDTGVDDQLAEVRGLGVAVELDDPAVVGAARAGGAATAGGKATALARAAAAGLPVLPGFVLLPAGSGERGRDPAQLWRRLSEEGRRPLAVRSSSAAEDTADSAMAGRFRSVLDVRGPAAFGAAVRAVRASAALPDRPAAPMAVLVQPMLDCRVGGVLFGADPVTGARDRLLVSAVAGGPDQLVGGAAQGAGARLSRRGRPLDGDDLAGLLDRAELRRLAALARRAARVFGAPQDIEFGFAAADGRLCLLQSRPITAMGPRPARRARLLGPGPVAETLPEPLAPLEEDLWVTPLAHGLATALDLAGAASRRRLRGTPVVRTVQGRAVADLALLGLAPPARRGLAWLNPVPPARRLSAAWRIGRLRGALPGLAVGLQADVDRELTEAPSPAELTPADLVGALRWSRATLVALHAQEALAGALLPEPPAGAGGGGAAGGGAAVALAALRHGRAEGLSDAELAAARPEVLALVPPSLAGPLRLPPAPERDGGPGPGPLSAREGLRLRARWVQEYQTRLVREVAARSVAIDRLALLRWTELLDVARGQPLPTDLAWRRPRPAGAPLPDAFRLAADGTVVAVRPAGASGEGRAVGVSPGRAVGVAWHGAGPQPDDAVLVVRHLDPALAVTLPALRGLVAQTGSPLSHLAVLARELRLPMVTGATAAVDRFPTGTRLLLDGATGELVASPAAPPGPAGPGQPPSGPGAWTTSGAGAAGAAGPRDLAPHPPEPGAARDGGGRRHGERRHGVPEHGERRHGGRSPWGPERAAPATGRREAGSPDHAPEDRRARDREQRDRQQPDHERRDHEGQNHEGQDRQQRDRQWQEGQQRDHEQRQHERQDHQRRDPDVRQPPAPGPGTPGLGTPVSEDRDPEDRESEDRNPKDRGPGAPEPEEHRPAGGPAPAGRQRGPAGAAEVRG